MAYEKQNFENGQILDAEQLNHIEDGITGNEEKISNVTDAAWLTVNPNLLHITEIVEDKMAGVTAAVNEDGTVTLNGTNTTANGWFTLYREEGLQTLKPNTKYTFSCGDEYAALRRSPADELKMTLRYKTADSTANQYLSYTPGAPYEFVEFPEGVTSWEVLVQCSKIGIVFNNVRVKPKIELGYKETPYIPYGASEQTAPDKNPPMITIIDDDGAATFKEYLLPLCQETNVPISSAVVTTFIGTDGYMTWDDILECCRGGAEILCHTYNHSTTNEEVTDVDDLTYNYRMAQNALRSHGINAGADILVYNNMTGRDPWAIVACKRLFKCGIYGTGEKTNYKETLERYKLKRHTIDAVKDGYSDGVFSVDYMKKLVDDVAADGGWSIWIMHSWPAYFTNDPDAAVDALRQAINYAKEKGVRVVSAEEGCREYVGV